MTQSQELYNKAKEDGTIVEKDYIKFKDDKTRKSTGSHTLKFIKDEEFNGTTYRTNQPSRKMRYTFEENGKTKLYETAIFKRDDDDNETDKLASFILQIQSFAYGDEVEAHYEPIEGTYKGFIKVSSTNTPLTDVIQEDDFIPDPNPENM